jgi:hypothetical protein
MRSRGALTVQLRRPFDSVWISGKFGIEEKRAREILVYEEPAILTHRESQGLPEIPNERIDEPLRLTSGWNVRCPKEKRPVIDRV